MSVCLSTKEEAEAGSNDRSSSHSLNRGLRDSLGGHQVLEKEATYEVLLRVVKIYELPLVMSSSRYSYHLSLNGIAILICMLVSAS